MDTAVKRPMQHVPAWKRLGLKLKYAKESDPDLSSITQPDSAHLQDQARSFDIDADALVERPEPQRSSKKRKLLDCEPRDDFSKKSKISNTLPAAKATIGKDVQEAKTGPGISRKKSVTFSSETKEEDGTSAQNLFKDWVAEQKADGQDASFTTEQVEEFEPPPAVHEANEPSKISKKTKKARKANPEARTKPADGSKDGKKAKSVEVCPESKETPAYIVYLHQFHTAKDQWKFNKARQNDLIKNVFNIFRVKPEHNEALIAYLSGLQGAAARQRLIEGARAVLQEIDQAQSIRKAASKDTGSVNSPLEMEDPKARRAAYYKSLEDEWALIQRNGGFMSEYDEEQLKEIRQEKQRGERAEMVLAEMLAKEFPPPATQTSSSSVATPSTAPVKAPVHLRFDDDATEPAAEPAGLSKPKRIRKRDPNPRTEVSSSESSSSSSSDSDSDSDDEAAAAGPPAKKARKAIFDDELLDRAFPKEQTYHETAAKRKPSEKTKGRGFAYTHGTRADESESEDE